MSAFMCDDLHLSYLAMEAVRREPGQPSSYAISSDTLMGVRAVAAVAPCVARDPGARASDSWYNASTADRAAVVFSILAGENIASLKSRYRDAESLIGVPMFDPSVVKAAVPSVPAMLKSLACYEYQSCEHSGWEASLAFKICRGIERALIQRLPGYDSAAWGAPV